MTDRPLWPQIFAVVAGGVLLLAVGPCNYPASRNVRLGVVAITLLGAALAGAMMGMWRRSRKNGDAKSGEIGIWRKPEKDKRGDDE